MKCAALSARTLRERHGPTICHFLQEENNYGACVIFDYGYERWAWFTKHYNRLLKGINELLSQTGLLQFKQGSSFAQFFGSYAPVLISINELRITNGYSGLFREVKR